MGKPRQEARGRLGASPEPALSLQLNGSATLGPAVGLLPLPRRDARPLKVGARCRVAGWGSVSDFEDLPPGLMEAEVRVLGLDACNGSWRGQLSPAMLCTRSGDRRRRGFCSVRRRLGPACGTTRRPRPGRAGAGPGPGNAAQLPRDQVRPPRRTQPRRRVHAHRKR